MILTLIQSIIIILFLIIFTTILSSKISAQYETCNAPGLSCCPDAYGSGVCDPCRDLDCFANVCQGSGAIINSPDCQSTSPTSPPQPTTNLSRPQCPPSHTQLYCVNDPSNPPPYSCYSTSTLCRPDVSQSAFWYCCNNNSPSTSPSPYITSSALCPGTCRSHCDETRGEINHPDSNFECSAPNNICCTTNLVFPTIPPYDLCANVPLSELTECRSCIGADYTQGVYTAIGCIKNDPNVFIPSLARLIIGIAGGIALLLMLVGAFLVTTAGGDPKKVESGKSTFTSAIIGLLVVIFSAVLLQFIGVQILRLPGL